MRRSTSPPPPPPLSRSGLLPSCDKAGASTHTPPPPPPASRGESSTGRPTPRENSEARLLHFEAALAKLESYAQAMKNNNNMQINDGRVGEKVVELFGKIYRELPPRLQEQLRAELKDIISQGAQEQNEPPKVKGTSTKRLFDWTLEHVVLPIGLGLLMALIVRIYFTWAGHTKGIPRC